jgi:hypothetical protein
LVWEEIFGEKGGAVEDEVREEGAHISAGIGMRSAELDLIRGLMD